MNMDSPVLVLNANFEPLGTCTTRRAMGLLLNGKVEIIATRSELIRTPTRQFPRPSIIRLSAMVVRPHPHISLTKKEVFRRDRYTCQYCGQLGHPLTLDHVFPRRRGGLSTWENLVTACPACNRRKGDRTPEEAGMRLRRQPSRPSLSAEYLLEALLEDNGDWLDYVVGW